MFKKIATYFESDYDSEPVLVRVLKKNSDDTFEVKFPDGREQQVNLHHLGRVFSAA